MRTTVNLDADAYSFASAYARGKGITLSVAMSELLRRAEKMPEASSSRLRVNRHGYLVVAGTGHVLTPEMVKEFSEDQLL